MATFYVCAIFDTYDPQTGLFAMKQDCILWDEELLGSWNGGPTFQTKEECYINTVCQESLASGCGLVINNIDLIDKTNNTMQVQIELPEAYNNTHIEYNLFDVNNTMLQDWTRLYDSLVSGSGIYNLDSNNIENTCLVGFRLVRSCYGSGSGSDSGGSDFTPILFNRSSWNQGQVPPELSILLDAAATAWENYISFDPAIVEALRVNDPEWNGISLDTVYIDDFGEDYIAACGPVDILAIGDNGIQYNALTFILEINTYFYPTNPDYDIDWVQVLIHELGHALGIGSLWNQSAPGVWLDGSLYPITQAAYNSTWNLSRAKVPLEDTSFDPIFVGSHWENNDRPANYEPGEPSYKGIRDIMIAFLSPFNITSISTALLLDLGYVQNNLPFNSLSIGDINSQNNTIYSNLRCGCSNHNRSLNNRKITKIYNKTTHTIDNANE